MTAPRDIAIPPWGLPGLLRVPEGAGGLVIFAHGSGSSRLSPRNTAVAKALGRAGFATLLFDLLTLDEARDRANVFDIPLLAGRLSAALDWAADDAAVGALPKGLFGASTGAAAALVCAAADAGTGRVAAVVSRGGRPDLAGAALAGVRAPVLLIVGGADTAVLDMNEAAADRLETEKRLEVVPGATHLFEEPGALEAVTRLAAGWFAAHLADAAPG